MSGEGLGAAAGLGVLVAAQFKTLETVARP